MGNPKVAAIIQARMGSTRLPGKVLMPLAGKPLLEHVIDRLRRSRTLDVIVIATSDQPCDDPLVAFAAVRKVELVRGSNENVLQRFCQAAEVVDADVIVRVTGDAPLVDPETLDRMVETLLWERAEYCTAEAGVPSIHEGFCTCTRGALNRLRTEAFDDPVAIEHVTAYFLAHPDQFHIARIPIDPDHRFEGARVSVDTPADVRFIEELYRRLGVPAGEADMADVVRLLRTHPELLRINGHVYQKKATDRSYKVLFRCDGDQRVGLGHVVRCLALAHELREKHGCGVVFAMASGEPGMKLVREAGFPLEQQGEKREEEWIDDLICRHRPHMLVLDVRNELSVERVETWRRSGIFTASIDDPTPRRLAVDLVFYPPVPQVAEFDWTGFTGEICCGWEWVLLRSEFSLPCCTSQNASPVVLVTMGGSDPANFTTKALAALDAMDDDFETIVVLGPGFAWESGLEEFLAEARRHYRIERNVHAMASLMRRADLAIASFGVTAYELAATGVPAVYFCLSEDHARSASRFVEDRFAFSCGTLKQCSEERISDIVRGLLVNPGLRHEMGLRARTAVDGQGASRIASKLMEKIERRDACNA